MRRIALSALALAMTLGSASLVAAQQPGQAQAQQQGRREWQKGRRDLRKKLFKDVKLSDQQKAQIKTINEKYRVQLKEARESLRPAVQEARADRQKGDQAAARAVFERNRGQLEQLRAQREHELREIRALLTPEQQKHFDANVAQLKARMQQRQERRHERQQEKKGF